MLAKHKSILFFGSAFLAFVLCIYITHNNITKTKPEKACVYLQKKFLQKENLLQNYVDSINKQGIDNISDLLLFCQKHKIQIAVKCSVKLIILSYYFVHNFKNSSFLRIKRIPID